MININTNISNSNEYQTWFNVTTNFNPDLKTIAKPFKKIILVLNMKIHQDINRADISSVYLYQITDFGCQKKLKSLKLTTFQCRVSLLH